MIGTVRTDVAAPAEGTPANARGGVPLAPTPASAQRAPGSNGAPAPEGAPVPLGEGFGRFALELARAVAEGPNALLENDADVDGATASPSPAIGEITEDAIEGLETSAEIAVTSATPLADETIDLRIELQTRGTELQRLRGVGASTSAADADPNGARAQATTGANTANTAFATLDPAPADDTRATLSDISTLRPGAIDLRNAELREAAQTPAAAVREATQQSARAPELPDFTNQSFGREGSTPGDLRVPTAVATPTDFSSALDGAARTDATGPSSAGARAAETPPASERLIPEIPVRNEQEILTQSRVLFDRAGGRAQIQLQPPQLGHLQMKLVVGEHGVRIDITADKALVAELLARHLPELQQAFESQGLSIERATIDLAGRDAQTQARERAEREAEGRGDRGRSDEDRPAEHGRDPAPRRLLPTYSLGAIDTVA